MEDPGELRSSNFESNSPGKKNEKSLSKDKPSSKKPGDSIPSVLLGSEGSLKESSDESITSTDFNQMVLGLS